MSEPVKHTSGPWFLFGNPAHCVGGPHPENGTGGVAMCGMRLRTPEEAAANARLIAAAPDLLAACRDMLAYFNERYDHMPTLVEVADRMRAAVAKAEGR